MRGLRWQLLAFIAALVLFSVVLLSRPQGDTLFVTEEPPTALPNSTEEAVEQIIQQPTSEVNEPVGVESGNPSVDNVITYREALVGGVQRLNPLFANLNGAEGDITSLIFEGLTRINEYGEAVPALAASWSISSDGLEYVVTLREDVLWQDGTPFTAADVEYTMSVLRSPDFPGERALGNFWRTVETDILSPTMVRFRLTQPLGSFLEALRIGILPAHALRGTTAVQLATHPFNLSPIGTGPYQLEAIRSSADGRISVVDLRVAPVYRQRPEGETGYTLSRVSFYLYDSFDGAVQALREGEVDGFAARNWSERPALLDVAESGVVTIRNGIEPTVGILIYNWANEGLTVFREQRVREALQIGLDRNFVERTLPNLAVRADSPLLPNSWAFAPDLLWPPFNPSQARDLLETVEINTEGDATPEAAPVDAAAQSTEEPTAASSTLFEFAILAPDDPLLVNVAQEIANQWSLLNVGVTIDAVDLETYRTRLEAHEFQVALVELTKEGSADPDVYTFWHQGQYPEGKNYGGADDRVISEILEKARRDPYGMNRINDYRRFQEAFIDRAIAIPLYYPLFTYAINAKVQGVQLGFISASEDRFMTIKDWTITQ